MISKYRLVAVLTIVTFLIMFASAEAAKTKTVAILPFENSSGLEKLEPLEEGLADLLLADLAKAEGITMVDRENLKRVAKEQRISLRGLVDKKTQVKIGKLVGANIMLAGGFSLVNSTMKINAHLLDVETTELIKSEEVEGKVTDIVEFSKELTLKLLRDLDVKIESLPKLDIDKSPEVNLHFIRGLGYYYGCMYDNAIMELMSTLNLDSGHADARFWMGRSYLEEKEYEHAKIEFDRFLNDFPENTLCSQATGFLKECERYIKKDKPKRQN